MISSISKTDQLKEILLKNIKGGFYKPGDKLPSILSICKEYNVSKPTVSQTLSNLSELGVLDLSHGKATRVSKVPFQNNIQILYSGLGEIEQQEFWFMFYQGIIDEINDTAGFSYSMRKLPSEGLLKEFNLRDLKNSVGALILCMSNPQLIDLLKRYGIKFVQVYDHADCDDISFVSIDYHEIMLEIIDLFLANNCTRIAYIGAYNDRGSKEINTSKYKLFLEAMRKRGISVNMALHRKASHHLLYTAYDAMKSLLEADEKPDAVFLSSDALAIGVYRALHEANIKIPEDIKIVACDNLEVGKYLIPSLSSIELSRYEIGRIAAKKLISNIKDGEKLVQINFAPKIIPRESLN